MKQWIVGLMCVGMVATTAMGQVNLAAGTPVSQNFDSIGTSATATLPTGWRADKNTGSREVGTYAAAVTATERAGGNSMITTAGNGIYNYGAGEPASAIDRAIGFLSSSTATKSGNLYVHMVNSGAASITSVDISYNVEKYRNGSNAAGFSIQLYYSTDGATWTSAGAAFLTSFPADADNSGFASAPGATVAVSGTLDLSATPISAAGALYLAWNYSVTTGTTTSNAQGLGVDDVSVSIGGPAVFSVSLDKSNGFTVEQGSSDAITATAANGTAPYGYAWSSTLGGTYYTAAGSVFTILATAPVGSYSATVTATDDAALTASNSVTFSVVAPATKYAIAITPPVNGTVTTTPAGEAEAGQTVTINATPAGGYAVDTITVVDADSANVPVTLPARTFTMPAKAVTVTVTFAEAGEAPDVLINFETVTGFSSYNPGNSTVSGVAIVHDNALRGNSASDTKNDLWSARMRHLTTNNAFFATTGAFAEPITKITFWYGNYGSENTVTFKVQVSDDGTSWQDVGAAAYDPEFTNVPPVQATIDSIPANMTYVKFVTTGGTSGHRVNVDDIGIYFGSASFSVSLNKANGFVVPEGSSDAITATAANGTAPYGYAWSSTLGGAYYTAASNVFTILATAPVGSYSATVTATDNAAQTASNSVTFSVVTPPASYGINITPPVNGTVTTDPADEALEGSTVTIIATPDLGYAVDTITVTDTSMNPVPVSGSTFTMPSAEVIVAVTFMVYEAPDVLIDFEDYTGSYAWNEYVAGGVTWTMTNVFAGNTVDDAKFGTKAGRFENNRGGAGNPAKMTSTAFAEPITKINFWYANFGVNDGGAFKVQVSDDGAIWTDVGEAAYNPDSKTLVQGVIESIPAGMTYVQFITTAGSAQRVNIDNIGLYFGAPAFSVSVNKANGFTVNEGQSDTITATAANGTGPYTYAWASTLGSSFRTTNGNVFTILATAPTGSYSATVTATDSSDPVQQVQRTVTFSVVGLPPGTPYVTITGDLTGPVDVQMNLVITLVNAVADDWFLELTDPDLQAVYSYGWDGNSAFTLTPTKVGTYVLRAIAETGSGNYSNTVNLVVSGGGEDPQIPAITFVAGTGFTFTLPAGFTLNRVEGADAVLIGQSLTWTLLTSPADYERSGTTVTIKSAAAARRMIRIWLNP